MESIVRFVFSARSFIIVPFIAVAIAVFGHAASTHAQPLTQADRAFIDTAVADAMKDGKKPGVSISVSGPKGSYQKGYGVSNRLTRKALTANDHFRVGSITKTFTAAAILRQVDKGAISLDDTVSKYVSGIPNGNIITVRDLLSMRSGLHEYTSDIVYQVSLALLPTMPFTPQNAVNIMKKKAPAFAPGTQYSYANSNYILLGLILEKTTGKKVQNVIADEVIKPSGLTNTTFPTNATMPAPYSRGYGPNPILSFLVKDYTAINPTVAWTAGAVVSTHADLAKFSKALHGGTLLSPAMQAAQQNFCPIPHGGEGFPAQAGYGFGMMQLGKWQGHNGSIPGFGSVAFYNPSNGATITIMTNTWRDDFAVYGKILPKVVERLYPGSMTTTPTYPNC